jgi:hypothetical protein
MLQRLSFLKKLKGLEWRNFLYPLISGIFFLLIVGLSFSVLQFLSKNLNKAFSVNEAAVQLQLVRVNRDNLVVAAKKLGIELVSEQPTLPPPEPPPPPESVEQPLEETLEEALEEDKTLLKIQVLNSTKTTGLAGLLKEELLNAGFLVENTGNFSTIQELTQVKIKEEKAASFPASVDELKQIVSEKYTLDEEAQNLEPDSPYDIVIIIGSN